MLNIARGITDVPKWDKIHKMEWTTHLHIMFALTNFALYRCSALMW